MVVQGYRMNIKSDEKNEFKYYLLICVVFLIGIVWGCIYFRNYIRNVEAKTYLLSNLSILENDNTQISKKEIALKSVFKNLKILIIFWVVGMSVIGSPFLLVLCCYHGFKLSFMISALLMNFRICLRKFFYLSKGISVSCV